MDLKKKRGLACFIGEGVEFKVWLWEGEVAKVFAKVEKRSEEEFSILRSCTFTTLNLENHLSKDQVYMLTLCSRLV